MKKNYYFSSNQGRLEDIDNIIKHTYPIDFQSDHFENSGIPIISDGKYGRVFNSEAPFLIIGNTGSGKSRRILIEHGLSLIRSEKNSVVFTDCKGEILKALDHECDKHGYKKVVLNLRNPRVADQFNLCQYPAKLYKNNQKGRADELFQSMFNIITEGVKSDKDPYWASCASSYLTGLALLCSEIYNLEDITLDTIYNTHIQGSERFRTSNYMKEFFKNHSDLHCYKLIAPYLNAPNETKASVDSVLSTAICKYVRNEDIVDFSMNSSMFNISDLTEEKTAVFIITRDESTVYNCLVSAIIDQIYEIIIDIAEEKYNGTLKHGVSFLLDEFSNLSPIPDIGAKISASRSRNIRWCLVCQSLYQLNEKYSEAVSKIIIGNSNIAYLNSTDITLLQMLSSLCGDIYDPITKERNPLISVEELQYFDKEQGEILFLLSSARLRPFISYLPDLSAYKGIKIKDRIEFDIRKKQIRKEVDFREIVNREVEIATNNTNNPLFSPFRIPVLDDSIPYRKSSPTDLTFKNLISGIEDGEDDDDENELDFSIDFERQMERIRERISEIEKDEIDELQYTKKCGIQITDIESISRTAEILKPIIGFTEELICSLLKEIKTNPCLIFEVPNETIEGLEDEFIKIGTQIKTVYF